MALLLARQKERGQDRFLVGHGRGESGAVRTSRRLLGVHVIIGDLFYLGFCEVLTAATCVVDDSYEPSRVPDVHTPALNHFF